MPNDHDRLVQAFEKLAQTIRETEPLAVVLGIKMPKEILWPNGETAQAGYICYGTNKHHPAEVWDHLGERMHLKGRRDG